MTTPSDASPNTTLPDSDSRAGLSSPIDEQLRDWRVRCMLDAIQQRDEYVAGNMLNAASWAGIRRHLKMTKDKPTVPALRRMITAATDAAIDELQRLREIVR